MTAEEINYVVKDWLRGDHCCAPPSPERLSGRNREWYPLYNSDVLSMPDKWEYPWYAAMPSDQDEIVESARVFTQQGM